MADYPFTTLVPNLGVVSAGDHTFTVADVPGLIPGASEGPGLGLDFLRHIERCAVLVHVVDCATLEPGRDPISDIDALEAELAATSRRCRAIRRWATRGSAACGGAQQDRHPRRQGIGRLRPRRHRGARLARLRGIHGEPGRLAAIDLALWDMVSAHRAAQPAVAPRRPVIRPIPVDETSFSVESDGRGGFVVRGARPER